MTRLSSVVIVGAGLAGAKAAEALRTEGFDRGIVIVGDEIDAPYERPPLSKGYLTGETPFADALVHPAAWYAEHAVELITGVTVDTLDAHERRLVLSDGRELTADAILLATGAATRTLPLPGLGLEGVHTLRTRLDADALRGRFAGGRPVAVIGAGWIGCEVAAAARAHGCPVTLLEADVAPLARVLGPELGARIATLHTDHGVDLRCRVAVESLQGTGTVEAVRLAGGEDVAAATVVVGVGVTPRTQLARNAGLPVPDGVATDARLRTAAPGIYAAGDVASAWHPRYGSSVRVEHWANAIGQGVAVAGSMLGRTDSYTDLPYFFSDLYESGLEYVGRHQPRDRVVVQDAGASLTALWLDAQGVVTAGLQLDDWDATARIRTLIGTRADPAVALSARAG
jgi:3-phenylpropionate/trans-cinnamate dioxygenase ferredoxin reductase subunit